MDAGQVAVLLAAGHETSRQEPRSGKARAIRSLRYKVQPGYMVRKRLSGRMAKRHANLDIEDAIVSLKRVEDIEPLLRVRTEGLTTMTWGLITAAIFLSYQVIHASAGHEGNMWLGFLWVPWVAAGVAATIVLWRTAHLSDRAGLRRGLSGGLPFLAVFLVVFAGALLAYLVIGDLGRLHEPGYITLVLGVAAATLAVSPVPRSSTPTRIVHLAAGILAVAGALLVAFLVRPLDPETAFLMQTLVGAFGVGGAWFVGGLLQAGKR